MSVLIHSETARWGTTRRRRLGTRPLRELPSGGTVERMDHLPALIRSSRSTDLALVRAASLVEVSVTPAAAAHLWAWDQALQLVACHESGHLVAAVALRLPVEVVTIKSRSGGHCELALDDDTVPQFSRDSVIRAEIVVALAGLAVEELLIGEGTDGSGRDLQHATSLALARIDAGLDPSSPGISVSAFEFHGVPVWLADERARAAQIEVARGRELARELVSEHRDPIVAFMQLLYEARRLDGSALDDAIRSVGLEPVARPS